MKRKVILSIFSVILLTSLIGLIIFKIQSKNLTEELINYQQAIKIKKPVQSPKGQFVYGADNSTITNLGQLVANRQLDLGLALRGYLALPAQEGVSNPITTLPIYEGVSDKVLAYGAGTAKPNQAIGKRNFAISGHNFADTKTFFSPLQIVDVSKKPLIYLYDGQNIFTYQLATKQIVGFENGNVLIDHAKINEITLTTCDQPILNLNPKKRIVISGHLIKQLPFKDANHQIQKLFI